jgi:UDP-3-O-[3-hydroxymyristoyl] glucosamine N-acyltransferase
MIGILGPMRNTMLYRTLDLAYLLEGELVGDPEVVITGLAKIEEAEPGELTFLANPKYEKYLSETRASAVLVSREQLAEGKLLIRVDDPYRCFAKLLSVFYPPEPLVELGVHPAAVLGKDVTIGQGVRIAAGVVIGAHSVIGDDIALYPQVSIGEDVTIGAGSIIRAGVSIRHGVRIGCRVIIQDNAVIGSDGFGFAPTQDGGYEKIPQVGTVIIEDDVEIGAGCTIDRATLGATRIESGAKLDNLIQIAHNVVIGANTVIAAQTGISGSTKIGKNCMIAGQVGFAGHLTLGDRSLVGAQSGVSKSWPDNSKIFGYPAIPLGEELRLQATMRKLPELAKTLDRLVKKVEELSAKRNAQ